MNFGEIVVCVGRTVGLWGIVVWAGIPGRLRSRKKKII